MSARTLVAYGLIALLAVLFVAWLWTTRRRAIREKEERHGPRPD